MTTPTLPLDGERLLQIARDTGLRHHLHGVAPAAARDLLTLFVSAAMAATTTEPMVRFCPGCGSVGAIDAKYLACCPDGDEARFIPHALAHKCRETFKLAIDKTMRVAVSVDTQAARRIIVDTLMQIADEAPINGNELAQARIRMAANRLRDESTQPSTNPGPLAAVELEAERYRFLRKRDLDAIRKGGVFAGLTPENVVLNGEDLDRAVDDAIAACKEGAA